MNKTNVFGKQLKIIRIECGEIVKDMASRLNISSAYLSSIENNTRPIPDDFIENLAREYKLSPSRVKQLEEARIFVEGEITLTLGENISDYGITLARRLAECFNTLTNEQILELGKTLDKFETATGS